MKPPTNTTTVTYETTNEYNNGGILMKLKDLKSIVKDYTMVRITDSKFCVDHVGFGIEDNLLELFGDENVICVDGYVEHKDGIRVKIENSNSVSYKRRLEPGMLFSSE